MTSSSRKGLEVSFEDHQNPKKWCVPLKEDAFVTFMEKGTNPGAHNNKVFGEGSLFSPLLFGKFFDPSDAFPLWEFDADVLLYSSCDSDDKRTIDWQQTDANYVLTADLPEASKNDGIQVCVERGKVVEISGEHWWMMQHKDGSLRRMKKDWREGNWWEYGFVRRIEVPENGDWRNMEASLVSDKFLEIIIPKNSYGA